MKGSAPVKTKEIMAKNVKPGATVILDGGLGTVEVAEKTKTARGNLRLSEAPVLRSGNRRKRRHVRRCIVVDPSTKMTVAK